MIDEKFSMDSFAKLGLDSEESRELANLLEQEVSKEMQEVIVIRFAEIVKKLNSMGHNLKLEQEPQIGDISYRDDYENAEYHCNLRLAFDFVTSAGYAHLSDSLTD